ncbi:MAG: heme exporter protein CcmB [Ectothiorhodospiraceae bacterium]|nr:heme exporter protein CcmB [Ectothiorhodospiraceae bacterium]
MSAGSPLGAAMAVLQRDLLLAIRTRRELVNPILFFVLVVSLFPLGVSPEQSLLRALGPGVLWVAALLATLLSLDGLFRSDFEDGSLEQMLISPQPLGMLVLAKILAHWLVTGLPLLLVTPLLATLLALPDHALPVLLTTLVLGTPVLSLVGAIGVALTVGLRRGGALLSLLVLPLYVPVLIFGSNAVSSAAAEIPVTGQLYMLGAMLALALTLAPIAAAAALRISLH